MKYNEAKKGRRKSTETNLFVKTFVHRFFFIFFAFYFQKFHQRFHSDALIKFVYKNALKGRFIEILPSLDSTYLNKNCEKDNRYRSGYKKRLTRDTIWVDEKD